MKTCTWPGCDEPYLARGLCKKGYYRIRTCGWSDHDTPPQRKPRPPRPKREAGACTWPSCSEPAAKAGLCANGYARMNRGWIDHDTPAPRQPKICIGQNCDKPAKRQGLCHASYERIRTCGWIDHDTPPQRDPDYQYGYTPSTTVYLIHNPELHAIKVGIGGKRRQQEHMRLGWIVLETWDFDSRWQTAAAERRVLDLWTGLRSFLTAAQMPQDGWTETIDADAYDATAVQFAVAG